MAKQTDYTKEYKEAEKFLLFNEDDPNLDTIKVNLPPCPDITTIDGYGKPAREQMFTRTPFPPRLKQLEKACETLDEIYAKLDTFRNEYKLEIEFIKQEWERRTNGYWFFNNGVPTYIDGWNYFFLNYWNLDSGLPEYRSRDRAFFIFARYCFTTTEAYYPYKVNEAYFSDEKEAEKFAKEHNAIVKKGDFIIDTGRRTVLGFIYPKHRREGATYRAECILYEITSRREKVKAGIQSLTGPHAFIAFNDKLIKPWKMLPFIWKPIYDGSTSPKEKLVFDYPSRKISTKGSFINIETGLESEIIWATSADGSTFDSDKFIIYHGDECGKTTEANVNTRHQIIKRCLTQGNGSIINGLALYTSTVGEMNSKGGANFFALAKKSHFGKRNLLGQTQSGLITYFRSAADGMEGFIDIFGNSIIEDPKEEDLWRIPDPRRGPDGRLIGAKRFLNEARDKYLESEDDGALSEYEEEVRLAPLTFDECFITAGSGTGFNLRKLNDRIKYLMFEQDITQKGNFKWTNGPDSMVEFEPNPNGRFVVSYLMNNPSEKYRKEVYSDGKLKLVWYPKNPGRFTASADPYKSLKTEHKRMSNLAGAVFMERDKNIDPEDKPISAWETYRFVCTYNNRPKDDDEAMEDMLMMSVYYGALMFPEINVDSIWRWFNKRGYSGYLKFERNNDGTFRKTPGYNANTGNQQKMMSKALTFIENHIQRERHIEILQDMKALRGIEDFTNRDTFVACAGCLIGSDSDYGERMEKIESQNSNLEDYFGKPKKY